MAQELPEESRRTGGWGVFPLALLTSLLLLALGLIVSISVGALKTVNLLTVFDAFFQFDGSQEQMIVRALRIPRALVAGLVGANLAVAGVLMQAMTRNPLASPGLFGVNAGASLLVVGALAIWPELPSLSIAAAAFAGAALGGILVYVIGTAGTGKLEPVRLALAGVTVTALLGAFTQGILVLDESTAQQVVYWLTGAVDGRDWTHFQTLIPWSIIGLIAATALAPGLDLLMLGEEIARGLGQNTDRTRLLAGLCVIGLSGAAVAVAGPIGFIGLIVPHMARRFSCISHTRLVPLSAVLGALLLIWSDVVARLIAFPFESPVGIVTALLGAPFFLYLARREKGGA